MNELRPSLWRTCRVLANEPRLQLIRHLVECEKSTVASLAQQVDIPPNLASTYLRAISARGLIQAEPKGRHVYYIAIPNVNVHGAAELLNALKHAFGTEMKNKEIIHYTTAFTHQRRIAIAKALQHRPTQPAELSARTSIPMTALLRHLSKLSNRDMAEMAKEHYRLAIPNNVYGHTLLLAALN